MSCRIALTPPYDVGRLYQRGKAPEVVVELGIKTEAE